MNTLYTVSVWLHILAASLWIGGMGFLVLVIVPILRRPGSDARQLAVLVHELGMRFRTVGWGAFITLILTGTLSMYVRQLSWADLVTGAAWENPVMRALTVKLVLVAVVLVLSAYHDFVTGPRATAAWKQAADAPETLRLRRQASRMGRLNALLALAIVGLAVLIVRGGL